MWELDTNPSRYPELFDGFVTLILEVNPNSDAHRVRESVRTKIDGLTAQEPFYLTAVLGSDQLTSSEKVWMYIWVNSPMDGGVRYPEDYHAYLRKQTDRLKSHTRI